MKQDAWRVAAAVCAAALSGGSIRAAPPHSPAGAGFPVVAARAASAASVAPQTEPVQDSGSAEADPPQILARAVTSEISTGSKTLDILLNLPPGALGASEPARRVVSPASAAVSSASSIAKPVMPGQPEILEKSDQQDAGGKDDPPELRRREWSGRLGGGIGSHDDGRPPGERGGNASDEDLRHLLPRWLVVWLKENRDSILVAAVVTVLLAGLVGWVRERAAIQGGPLRREHRHRRRRRQSHSSHDHHSERPGQAPHAHEIHPHAGTSSGRHRRRHSSSDGTRRRVWSSRG